MGWIGGSVLGDTLILILGHITPTSWYDPLISLRLVSTHTQFLVSCQTFLRANRVKKREREKEKSKVLIFTPGECIRISACHVFILRRYVVVDVGTW